MRQQSNYKILGLVGRGQFGRVFAAIDRASGTLVALKELKSPQLPISSFLRELNFLTTQKHSNIVTCRALEHYGNDRYIVMDYCEGGTLRSLIDNSPLNLDRSLQLVIDLLSGLEFAHSKGVVHGDIKPENILLKASDRIYTPCISDFGIAKLHREIDRASIGSTGTFYMPPEQFYGQYSYSCDLYGVGIILFELVVGKHLAGMPQELLTAHLSQPVTIPESVPFILRSAIARSLQKLPRRRFKTARQMRESLRSIQSILKADSKGTSQPKALLTTLPVSTEILPQSATHLAIASEQVYLASKNLLTLQSYRDSDLTELVDRWEFTLDTDVRSLQLSSSGCFIVTSASLYYLPYNTATSEFRFFAETLLPIASFPTANLVTAIDPQGYWFAASYLPNKSKTAAWEIFKLPNCQLKRSQVNRQLWNYLIGLNRRYGLGIYQNNEQNTEFHLFDRRSNWLANFTIGLQLGLVTYNPLFPHRILATEVNNSGVIISISLKQFHVERICLEFTPTLITSCPQGYLLSDRQGRIALLDGNSFKISQFQVPLSAEFMVAAVSTSKTQLLVASASSQACLQKFSWDSIYPA